jgi:hypothetical protein
MKQQSKQWTAKGETARKVMVTAFWDSYGILLIDYLEKGKSITGVYYASLLDKLKAELRQRDRI